MKTAKLRKVADTYGDKRFFKFIKKHKLSPIVASELQNLIWEIEDYYEAKLNKK